MRIIDAHAHIPDRKGYVAKLLETMNKCNIEKSCISGLGKLFNCVDNHKINKIINQYPERFIGAYFIRPGVSRASEIEEAHNDGFRMLKVTIPRGPYDDEKFDNLWKRAQELNMPVLFHTGVVTLPQHAPEERINSWWMHPLRLEPISNSFPELKIIVAHLGIHWNEEAAELLRMRPNVYADLTGEPDGWRIRMDRRGLKQILWWEGGFDKLVFGTDVSFDKIPTILTQDKARLESLNINKKTKQKFFSKNILTLLGEK